MTQDTPSYFNARGLSSDSYAQYRLPPYLENLLPPVDEQPFILDIGCGYGQFLRELRTRGYDKIRGIDVEDEAVAHGNSIGLEIVKIRSVQEYAKESMGVYDLIVMSHILEHIEKKNIIPTLESVRSMLSAKGWLVLMVPNAQSNTGCYWAYEDFTHHTIFTSGSITYVLKMAGFREIQFIDIACTAGLNWPKKTFRLLFLMLYRLQRQFWNKVTCSAYHAPSPIVLSYEIKARAR